MASEARRTKAAQKKQNSGDANLSDRNLREVVFV
jgi:hypothetical protein